jgi:Tol biopolymer transport system component
MLTVAVAAFFWPKEPAAGRLSRVSLLPPPGNEIYPDSTGVAVSPDGTAVVFVVGSVTQSATQLWIRPLDSNVAHRLDDTDGAVLPFWSPDSRRIGFFTNAKLKTIAVTGGRAETLCDAPGGRGAAWSRSNVIVFAPDAGGPLYRIPASGGTPEPVTKIDPAKKEFGHRFPVFLPDGEHFLYASLPGKAGRFDIYSGSLGDDSRTLVGSMESAPVYAEPGWLLYARQGVLAAQAFDARTLKMTGDPVPLGDEPTSILDPAISFTAGRATSVSVDGTLAYFSSPSMNTQASWYDASGRRTGSLNLPPGHYETVNIAPDGTHAVFVRSTSPSESALWLVDLARGGAAPLSTGRGRNDTPVWSPDGRHVLFAADRDGPQHLYVKSIDDATPERVLFRSEVLFKGPTAWSPDSKWILMTQLDPDTAQNVWLLPASGGQPKQLVQGPTRDNGGTFTPDGRWFWYASDETGRFEIYVQSFPEPGRRVQVSKDGAANAWWTRDGRQMLVLGADLRTLWRIDVSTGTTFTAGEPRQIATFPANVLSTDAMPDRERFLVVAPETTGIGSLPVVFNWRAALDQARR